MVCSVPIMSPAETKAQKAGHPARSQGCTKRYLPLRIHLTDRSRLILVALATAVVTALGIVLVAVYVPAKYTDRIQGKWVRFGVMTAGLIVFSLSSYWKARKSLRFWSIFLIFLALHLLGVGHLWAVYNGLSTLAVGLVGGVEWGCMALFIYWILGVGPDLRRHHSPSSWIPTL